VKFPFDLLLDTGKDVSVDVVYEVESGEQDESGGRSHDGSAASWFGGRGHWGKDSRGVVCAMIWSCIVVLPLLPLKCAKYSKQKT